MKYQRIYIVFAFLLSFASVTYAYDGGANNSTMATSADVPREGNNNIIASGECGEHATWSLDENGKLTIGGYGDMYNYGRNYDEGLAPWLTSYAKIKSIEISGGITAIGDNTFGIPNSIGATINVGSISLPNGIKRIGKSAFMMCRNITSIVIPNSVTSIDDYAFMELENLTSVKLSNSLTRIGEGAFFYTGINSIELPNTLTSIGEDAFGYCDNLKNITNYAYVPQSITTDIFLGVTGATLHVKKGYRDAYANAVIWKNFSIVEDADESVNISKIVDTILKRNGTSESMSDVNNDGVVSIADVVCAIDSNKKNVHDYVDLGLSVKWATCNVGASKPEDYGGYYAWGETEEKSTYDWSTYKWCNGSETKLTKYCTTSRNGFVDNKMVLELHDDVAHVKWGGSWRMPTTEEFAELRNRNNCTWTWTSQNGVNGYRVTSVKNGNSIFLPAAYYRVDSDLPGTRSFEGFYWTSSLYTFNPVSYLADNISFYLNGTESNYHHYRSYGLSVRPVCDDAVYVSHIAFNELSIAMKVDELKAISYTVSPSDATNQEMVWSSSDETVATVSDGIVTAKGTGKCTIRATATDGTGEYCECTINVEAIESPFKYVNLGLSVKWATCNVGAEKPEDYGDYFAWGETIGYNEGRTDFNRNSYKWCNKIGTINKYCNSINDGLPDYKIVLEPEDDVAFVKSDGFWRMPTKEEMEELMSSQNCTWTWTTLNDVYGYRVTSLKNGNSIFLPAAGYAKNSSLTELNSNGHYWSNLLNTSGSVCAFSCDFGNEFVQCRDNNNRFNGLTVRPVYEDPNAVHKIAFDKSFYYMVVDDEQKINYTLTPSNATNKQIIWSSSNKAIATVSNGIIKARGAGTCSIKAIAADGSGSYCECTVDVVEPNCEYIDLGLSVKWATCNVGAGEPEDYGDYFAWGETSGYNDGKTEFNWDTYKWCNGTEYTMTKYCTSPSYGTVDNKIFLDPEDDVAHVKIGESWRIPTQMELEELQDSNNCTWTWTTRNGVNGYKITSLRNGNSIFLPAGGSYDGSKLSSTVWGFYRSSTIDYTKNIIQSHSNTSYDLIIHPDGIGSNKHYRFYGMSVRPVYDDAVHVSNIVFKPVNMKVGETKALDYTILPSNATNHRLLWSSSNTAIATVTDGIVTAKGEGTCTIIASATDGSGVYSECTVNCKNNCEYVDLGLSVKWATCNVGAATPEDYGDYYAWGEYRLYGEGKIWFDWRDYWHGTNNYMLKYNGADYRKILEPNDDVAHVKWGGNWRMPTKEEMEELINTNNCTWTWTTLNNVYGYRVTSLKNGNSIFLPAAGRRSGLNDLEFAGSGGEYWSSSLCNYNVSRANSLSFRLDYIFFHEDSGNERCLGLSVRPVLPY